jgi:hypothetical protein
MYQMKVGDKLYGDHGALRAILEIEPDRVLVVLWDMYATNPIGKVLAQDQAQLGETGLFSFGKQKAAELIASERGLHTQEEWDRVRREIIWKTPEELARQS